VDSETSSVYFACHRLLQAGPRGAGIRWRRSRSRHPAQTVRRPTDINLPASLRPCRTALCRDSAFRSVRLREEISRTNDKLKNQWGEVHHPRPRTVPLDGAHGGARLRLLDAIRAARATAPALRRDL